MPTRDDVHGNYRAPKTVEDFLLKSGGKNPHGEPNYRLVHSSCRRVKRGGVWNVWPEGASLQDRGGVKHTEAGLVVPTGYKPISQIAEMREITKYGHMGGRWILERWCPAHMYGTRKAWERLTVPGHPDLGMLGPYPEFGDYELASTGMVTIPDLSQLEKAIQECEFLRNDHPATVEQAVIEAYNEAVEEYEKEAKAARESLEMEMMDAMIPDNRISLAAGRHRESLAKRLGIREHCGN